MLASSWNASKFKSSAGGRFANCSVKSVIYTASMSNCLSYLWIALCIHSVFKTNTRQMAASNRTITHVMVTLLVSKPRDGNWILFVEQEALIAILLVALSLGQPSSVMASVILNSHASFPWQLFMKLMLMSLALLHLPAVAEGPLNLTTRSCSFGLVYTTRSSLRTKETSSFLNFEQSS